MGEYEDLAALAEAGRLQPTGESLSGDAAAEFGQAVLMNATGVDNVDEAVAIALGQRRLDRRA